MRNKCLSSIIVCFVLLLSAKIAFSVSASELDKTGWFNCVDSDNCSVLADKFKKIFKKRGYRPEDAVSWALTSLLSEHLKDTTETVNLSLIETVSSLANRYKNDLSWNLVFALKCVVLTDKDCAKNYLDMVGPGFRNTVSLRIITALINESNEDNYYKTSILLSERNQIPFLSLMLSKKYLYESKCKLAISHLGSLVKTRDSNSGVVSYWAMAKMDCEEYPNKIFSKLRKTFKKNLRDWLLIAQMIRFKTHIGDDQSVQDIISEIDLSSIKGSSGAELLFEYARYRLRNGDIDKAEALLNKAIKLNPNHLKSYRELGRFYLRHKKNLPKAVANLRQYIRLGAGGEDVEKLKRLVADLESEISGTR